MVIAFLDEVTERRCIERYLLGLRPCLTRIHLCRFLFLLLFPPSSYLLLSMQSFPNVDATKRLLPLTWTGH